MKKALIICKNTSISKPIVDALSSEFSLDRESDLNDGINRFKQTRYEYTFIETDLLIDQNKSQANSFGNALENFKTIHPMAPLIVFSKNDSLRQTIQAVREGAHDYLICPTSAEEVKLVTANCQSNNVLKAELDYLKDEFWDDGASDLIETCSQQMKDVYTKVKAVADTSTTILLTGETGVGKSMIAKLIHEHSIRKKESLVAVHCGAIPDNLVESELFGHEKGSFTGAIKRKLGRFEIAHRGTIFLDEIGTISSTTQVKLLQVLQDSVFQRIGGESDIKVDVRIITATNENLKELCNEKVFRQDLYFRLNVFPIHIPPLRERLEDIPLLCTKFLKNLNRKHSKIINNVSTEVYQALSQYNWPGNIRELENVIERAYILESSNSLTIESLPQELINTSKTAAVVTLDTSLTLAEARNKAIEDLERQYLKEALTINKGKINETAQTAGVGARQIHKLMSKYGISKDEYKL